MKSKQQTKFQIKEQWGLNKPLYVYRHPISFSIGAVLSWLVFTSHNLVTLSGLIIPIIWAVVIKLKRRGRAMSEFKFIWWSIFKPIKAHKYLSDTLRGGTDIDILHTPKAVAMEIVRWSFKDKKRYEHYKDCLQKGMSIVGAYLSTKDT